MNKYNELLQAGNKAQLEKLKENEHKTGFDNIDIFYATQMIFLERSELVTEVNNTIIPNTERLKRIRREAADIANFAHMIILKCDKELNK